MRAKINGVPHPAGTGDGVIPCPGAFPIITNIADEKHPRAVGTFRMNMNKPENCPAAVAPTALTKTVDGKDDYPTISEARAAAMNRSSKASFKSHGWIGESVAAKPLRL